MITGFYVSALAKKDIKKAELYLAGINNSNYKSKNGGCWGFYEFLNSKTFHPNGPKYQAWSAAATIMAYHSIANPKEKLFL